MAFLFQEELWSVLKKEFESTISKEEINELPLLKFEGKIHLISDDKDVPHAYEYLKNQKALGFDTETRPSFRKGESHKVALLQLSTATDTYLFRLNKISLKNEIFDLLANPQILKIGIAVRDDIKGLQKLKFFEPAGFIELADVAKKQGILHPGLRTLCALVLGKRLSKRSKLTNWELSSLSPDQVEYAALDSWLGLELYKRFNA